MAELEVLVQDAECGMRGARCERVESGAEGEVVDDEDGQMIAVAKQRVDMVRSRVVRRGIGL